MWFPCLAENRPDARRAGLGHLYENAFVFVRDHCSAAIEYESNGGMGRPGLEPGTNPECFGAALMDASFLLKSTRRLRAADSSSV